MISQAKSKGCYKDTYFNLTQCNTVTAICVCPSKRYLVTADSGADSIIIIWDLGAKNQPERNIMDSGTVVKTIFDPHAGTGVIASRFTADSKYLITLGAGTYKFNIEKSKQTIQLWDWQSASETAAIELTINGPIQVRNTDSELDRCIKL